jgi:hypothetical protein
MHPEITCVPNDIEQYSKFLQQYSKSCATLYFTESTCVNPGTISITATLPQSPASCLALLHRSALYRLELATLCLKFAPFSPDMCDMSISAPETLRMQCSLVSATT